MFHYVDVYPVALKIWGVGDCLWWFHLPHSLKSRELAVCSAKISLHECSLHLFSDTSSLRLCCCWCSIRGADSSIIVST